MAWYDIPGVSCIFALDYNSVVSLNGSRVALSNNPTEYLNTQGGRLSITKEESLGWDVKRFLPEVANGSLKYKVLRVAKSNLVFTNPKPFPGSKKVTFILRTKLKSSSKFMNAAEGSDLNYGLSFTEEGYNSYNNLWRFKSVSTEPFISLEVPYKDRFSNFRSVFDTVVLRLDWEFNTGHLRTTYGSLYLPTATIENAGLFVKAGTFKVLGSANSSWELDADIVAYGMFDGYLTDQEVDTCLANIDSEFLLEVGLSKGFVGTTEDFKITGLVGRREEKIDFLTLKYSKLSPKVLSSNPIESNIVALPYMTNSSVENLRNFYKNPPIFLENKKPFLVNKRLQKTMNLTGIITEEDTPISTKLYIYEKGGGLLISSTFSNKDGVYVFRDLDPTLEYVVTSFDRKYQYKSIIQDFNTKDS